MHHDGTHFSVYQTHRQDPNDISIMARTTTPKGSKSAAKTGEAAGETKTKESDDEYLLPSDRSTSSEESESEEAKTDEAIKAAQAKMDEAAKATQAKEGATASRQKATETTPPIGSHGWWQTASPAEAEQFYMRRLFRKLRFTDEAAKYATEVKQVHKASVLKDLDYDQCEQIVKNIRKQNSIIKVGTTIPVADQAMRKFQLAVTMAKHYARTARELTPDDIDVEMFPAYTAQKEIEDQQRKEKPHARQHAESSTSLRGGSGTLGTVPWDQRGTSLVCRARECVPPRRSGPDLQCPKEQIHLVRC